MINSVRRVTKKSSLDAIEAQKQEMSTTADKISEILQKLSQPYDKIIRPLEGTTGFNMYCMSPQSPNHLEMKPMCLFLGSYSAGKTTAIAYLLQDDSPELRTGPEPTTDVFHVLKYGEKKLSSDGVILMNDPSLGFQNFCPQNKNLSRHFRLTRLPNLVLKGMDIIDTPGFLSGENMSEARGYSLPNVVYELGKMATRLYFLMDTSKVDVSPELKQTMGLLRRYLSKTRMIFNKCDSENQENFLRLYGAIMYMTGQAIAVPEVPRVFMCSLWDKPYKYDTFRDLFDHDKLELLNDMKQLPACHYPHIVGNQIERLNTILVYTVVVRNFKKSMPFFKKDTKKQEILSNFDTFYEDALKSEGIVPGDSIIYDTVLKSVKKLDPNNLPDSCNKKAIDSIKHVKDKIIPVVLSQINNILNSEMNDKIEGGVFEQVEASNNLNVAEIEQKLFVTKEAIEQADNIFKTFSTVDGRVDSFQLKEVMMRSRLPQETLASIWGLASDIKDGKMDMYEWRVANYLINLATEGNYLPQVLPPSLRPSNMRPDTMYYPQNFDMERKKTMHPSGYKSDFKNVEKTRNQSDNLYITLDSD